MKSPVSGKNYKVNVGCYQDKDTYGQVREEAIWTSEPNPKIGDCSDVSKENKPY